jgi:hypothetical protein
MLKRLAFKYWPMVVLLVLIGAVLDVSRYAENRKTEHQENAQGSSPNAVISPNCDDQCAKNANKPHQAPNWIDMFTWPEGVGAWALLLTLVVIAWQSTETRDAAQYASLNAQILVNTERPWLFVSYEHQISLPSEDDPEGHESFALNIINKGRGPAQIVSYTTPAYRAVAKDTNLPKEPEYGQRIVPSSPLFVMPEKPVYELYLSISRDDAVLGHYPNRATPESDAIIPNRCVDDTADEQTSNASQNGCRPTIEMFLTTRISRHPTTSHRRVCSPWSNWTVRQANVN